MGIFIMGEPQKISLVLVILFLSCPSFAEKDDQALSKELSISHHKRHNYTSYNLQAFCTPAFEIQHPTCTREIQRLVKHALNHNLTIKAVGSLHSITDITCTEGIAIAMTNFNYTHLNDDNTVTVGAGTQLADALEAMHEKNRTLIHCPAYGGITVGGALGTGAHGSSLLHPASLSDQVVGLTVVNAQGKVIHIKNPETLKAFRVHLGLLGIIVDVTLQTVPLFKMTVQNNLYSDEILTNGVALKWARTYDYFAIWWFPSSSSVVVASGTYWNFTDVAGNAATYLMQEVTPELGSYTQQLEEWQESRNEEEFANLEESSKKALYDKAAATSPIYSEDGGKTLANPATGYAWKLLQNRCTNCVWKNGKNASLISEDLSISVSVDEFTNAVKSVKKVVDLTNMRFYLNGIFFRFTKASDSLMATSSGQDTVDFEWFSEIRYNQYTDPMYGLGAQQAIQQSLVAEHKGRPHWGKNGLYYLSRDILKKSATNRAKFIQAVRKYDPNGLFSNKFRSRLLGTSNAMNVNPKVHRCALEDYCVCKKDKDCGLGQNCGEINGFRVCLDG